MEMRTLNTTHPVRQRRNRLLYWAAASALAAAFLVVAETAAPRPARATEVPWECAPTAYLFQSPAQAATSVYATDLVTGASTRVGGIGDYVNAVGFNRLDNFMYSWNKTQKQLVRISSDFNLTRLGLPRSAKGSMRTDVGWSSGDINAQGRMWFLEETGPWAEVDLTTNPPALVAQGTATSSAGFPIDWAFIDGTLYGVVTQTVTGQPRGVLVSLDTATHQFTNRGVLNTITGETGGYGASYSDGAYLYVSNNRSGNIYRINPASLAAIKLSSGPAVSNNDGSMCHTPLPTVTLVKNVGGRLVGDDQFSVALINAAGTAVTEATTTGTQTTVTSTDQPVRRGNTYVIADRLTDASHSQTGDYTGSLSCVTDTGGLVGTAPVVIATWTLTITADRDYVCTITNTPLPATPQLELVKSVAPTGSFATGDVLTYSFVVTNLGNVPVSGIGITEVAFSGAGTMSTPTCLVATLLPRATTTCTATYTVQAADVIAGNLANTARATGTDPEGGPVSSNDDSADLPATPVPSLTIEKTAFPPVILKPGEVVRYRFIVTNTGNVSIEDVAVGEDSFNGTGAAVSAVVCDRTTLVPGQRALCSATYTATQADIDRDAPLTNTAHATGTDPGGSPVTSPPDDATVPVHQSPQLDLVKTARTAGNHAGDNVTYRYQVTNTGNTTVAGIDITEDTFSGTGTLGAATCPTTILVPGASTTCSTIYRLAPADIGAGTVANTAHAQGQDPQGTPVTSNLSAAVIGFPQPVRIAPRITTRVSDRRVAPGQKFHDRVRLRGLIEGTKVKATARLYGPFSSRGAATCKPAHLERAVTWRARSGWTSSPPVSVTRPGVYTWRTTTKATAANGAATHRCGLKSETLTAAKPAYQAPIVNGGFSGALLPDRERRTLTSVHAPAFGLHAKVLTAGIARDHMNLPANVGTVARLRNSADYGDKIGTIVIGGHVSDRHDRPGALYGLRRAERGDVIFVSTGSTTRRYKVIGTTSYQRGRTLPQQYFATNGKPRLVIISCTARVVYANGHFHYTRYQVVSAKPNPRKR
jgi:hypothetical protein